MRELLLTFFYSGRAPVAPGTFGTLAALPFALIILAFMPPSTLFLLSLLLFVVFAKTITAYEQEHGSHDEKKIVIDEVAGVWLALSIAPGSMVLWQNYIDFDLKLMVPLILSVLYFRLFDIWKPSFIGRIDREVPGGWGVMGDDIAAGFVAGLASALTWSGIEKLIAS